MHYYSERRVKGIKGGKIAAKNCDITIRVSREIGTPGMIDGVTLSLSDNETVLLMVSEEGVRAILDMLAESSPEGGIEWGF